MFARYYEFSKRVAHDFAEHGCTHMAGAISYYALVSLVPLGILLIAIASFIFSSVDVERRVLDVVDDMFPLEVEGRENVVEVVDSIIDARGFIGLMGLIGVTVSAAAMFGALRTALNNAWDVKATHSWPVQKLIDILAVGAIGILFLASVAATGVLQVARNVTEDLGYLSDLTGPGWDIVFALLPPFISFTAFAVIYRFVPNRHVRWEYVILGALLATFFFEVAKNGFAYYLRYYTTFDETYGSVGAMFAFVAWIYVSSVITLIGAEVTSEYARMMEAEEAKERVKRPQGTPARVSEVSGAPPEMTS
ncbi:MAG TPA: YihY/virulence factor BrkB family protein [Dehalococcoidia bacterium]|nr:YihY/virulence factor BrkB family protein [Dehalococcoidia bacterium]